MTGSGMVRAVRDRPIDDLVSGIGTLQLQVGARAREAPHRALQAALPPAAHVARPPSLGEEVEHVGPAQESDHLAAPDHRHPAYALADEKPGRLVDPGFL